MRFSAVFVALMLIAVLSSPAAARMACNKYEHARTRELVKLVRDAAKLVRTKGEAAFSEFEKKGSRWNSGDRWVTVTDLSGKGVCNPRFTQAEGRDLLEFRDRNGKPVLNYMLREVTGDAEEGWTFFYWPKPGEDTPKWRSLYVAYAPAPSGKEYIVSAGDYDLPMERCFVRNQVDQVADLIESMGKEAFPLIRGRDGEYFWRDTYVFVMAPDGTELVNPAFPENEGRNMIKQNGPARQYMPMVLKKGSVWVRYDWPKPGSDKPEQKRTYLRKVEYEGNVYVVGCGVYLSDE